MKGLNYNTGDTADTVDMANAANAGDSRSEDGYLRSMNETKGGGGGGRGRGGGRGGSGGGGGGLPAVVRVCLETIPCPWPW